MSDVNETLQELMTRRLREMGRSRGHDEPLPLKQAHENLPIGQDGKHVVSYETFRQIHKGVHSGRISDATAEALALALKVDIDDVYVAAGQRRRLGPFLMPDRAEQLTDRERRVVLGVVDAILEASERVEESAPPNLALASRKNPKRKPRGPREQRPD